MESNHTDSIKAKSMCISHITSKIAYHKEWAAGCPSFTKDTTVVVFSFCWQWQSGAIQVCVKQVWALSECWLQCRAFCLCNPLRLGALTKTSQYKHACQLFFEQLKQMVGQLTAYHTSKGWFCFILVGLMVSEYENRRERPHTDSWLTIVIIDGRRIIEIGWVKAPKTHCSCASWQGFIWSFSKSTLAYQNLFKISFRFKKTLINIAALCYDQRIKTAFRLRPL